jgi:glycine dehydrogenase subunit 1
MRYLPHTEEEVAAMLGVVGAADLDSLFDSVPPGCRMQGALNLPEPLTEWELTRHVEALAAASSAAPEQQVFLGAGSYSHHIPAVVQSLASRAEFATAYTPYQPEVAQGTLQAIFEYQTLVCRLLGMEVANASLYDGASALVEGALMAIRITGRERVAVSAAVNPFYRTALATALRANDLELVELPSTAAGLTDFSSAPVDAAAMIVQSPNFFGCIEDLAGHAHVARAAGAMSVVCFSEAMAYGLLRSPGSCGADIVCGEGQSLGLSQSFGGPYLGLFAARSSQLRSLPGRLVGKTADAEGREGFVLTLATREQHIRREKATSNICSNQSLCALTAAVYLATVGKEGLRRVARLNYDKAEYLKARLAAAGVRTRFAAPTFNEFVVEWPGNDAAAHGRLAERGMVAGLPLGSYCPELAGCTLLCVTETKSRADIDALVEGMTHG